MNGLVERQNQGILRTLRIAKATSSDWRKAVKEYVYIYNTTPHSVTEKAPMELLTGRPVKDLLPSLRTDPCWLRDESVRDNDAIKKIKGKIYADQRRHAKSSEIKVGDDVMIKNYNNGKLEPKYRLEKFRVIHKVGNDTVVVNVDGVRLRRCVTHLKKWPSSSLPLSSSPLASESSSPPSPPKPLNREQQGAPSAPSTSPRTSKRKNPDGPESFDGQRPKRNRKLPRRFIQFVNGSD